LQAGLAAAAERDWIGELIPRGLEVDQENQAKPGRHFEGGKMKKNFLPFSMQNATHPEEERNRIHSCKSYVCDFLHSEEGEEQ